MKPDVGAYLESWTNELYSRADRVRQLIGDAHWLSDGHHKEGIIREFLARHLPPNLNIQRGFVRAVGGSQHCSPENDILISDFSAHPPYFFEGDLQIVPPSSVVGHIEIKTTFSKATSKDALLNIFHTKKLLKVTANFEKTWSGIYFFQNGRSVDSFHETLLTVVKEVFNEVDAICDEATFVKLLPKCITCVSDSITFLSVGDNNEIVFRTFKLGKTALPCSFFDLMGSVRSYLNGPVVTDFDEMLFGVDIEPPVVTKFKLR